MQGSTLQRHHDAYLQGFLIPFLPQEAILPCLLIMVGSCLTVLAEYNEVIRLLTVGVGVVGILIASAQDHWRQNSRQKTSLSPLTLIQLANGPYMSFTEPLPLLGWKRLKRYHANETQKTRKNHDDDTMSDNNNNNNNNNNKGGPCIDVFYHARDKNLVLSVRGTDPSLVGDLSQDLQLVQDRIQAFVEGNDRHQLPAYAMDLLQIMDDWERAFSHCQLYLTGHSLGAACCEAAWTADLALKTRANGAAPGRQGQQQQQDDGQGTEATTDFRVWRCVTWESPGFAVNTTFRETLQQNRDILDSHVVHYLGAPNVINCLHRHISTNRRYRIFLGHDSKLTSWHLVECFWRNAVVLMNWICLARIGIGLTGNFLCQAADAADIAAQSARPAFSMEPRALWKYVCHEWHCFFATPTCPCPGTNLRAAVDVLKSYDQGLGQTQILLSGWFKNIMPIGDKLTWSVVRGNALLQGDRAVEYLLRQHSLRNHIDSFDIKSGYPLKWVQMDSWPTLAEIITKTLWESARSCVVPILPDEMLNPELEIENKVARLSGYQERRRCTADCQVLKDHYNYLGEGFFDTIITISFGMTPPLCLLEEQCREEYRRCRRRLPTPVFIVG